MIHCRSFGLREDGDEKMVMNDYNKNINTISDELIIIWVKGCNWIVCGCANFWGGI